MLFDQLCNGADFDSPEKLLRTVSAEKAAQIPTGSPYSIATNVAHAEIWQRIWLTSLANTPRPNPFPDFPIIEPNDWPNVRQSFLAGLEQARQIATTEPLAHKMKSDDQAIAALSRIALHAAYHLGQVKLLKRQLRIQKTSS